MNSDVKSEIDKNRENSVV